MSCLLLARSSLCCTKTEDKTEYKGKERHRHLPMLGISQHLLGWLSPLPRHEWMWGGAGLFSPHVYCFVFFSFNFPGFVGQAGSSESSWAFSNFVLGGEHWRRPRYEHFLHLAVMESYITITETTKCVCGLPFEKKCVPQGKGHY
jgi:hypothetical protein